MGTPTGLSDIRVLDFTGELGPYAGKMFAGLGADVIHLESPSGDPMRNMGPFYKGVPGRERGLQFLYYNAGKRGMVLDLSRNAGREIFMKLVEGADLLLESFAPGYLEKLGLSHEHLRRVNPALVHTAVTPFGHFGPYRDYPGSDLTCSALGGFLFLGGVENEKPVRACDSQSYRMAEAYAGTASAVALFRAKRTGRGQFVDVSCMESVGMALENAPQYLDLEGKNRRGGGREAGFGTIHPCRDGHVALVAIIGRNRGMWDHFVRWMEREDVMGRERFEDEAWLDPDFRAGNAGYGEFCRIFEAFSAGLDKADLYERAQANRVALSPVSNGRDLLENPQLRHRGFWKTLMHEHLGGEIVYPGAPYELGELRWRLGGAAPEFGGHTREILMEIGYSEKEVEALTGEGVVYAQQRG